MEVKYRTIDEFKGDLAVKCHQHIGDNEVSETDIGFIEPGHGIKGKQLPLTSDEQLHDMYTVYKGKREILVWLKVKKSKKRSKSPCMVSDEQSASKKTRYDSHLQRMTEVEDIVNDLQKKHACKFSPEQFRAWAHMIQLKKHESYNVPPSKPFFGQDKGKHLKDTPSVGISPGKRINLRTECINQLDKWHDLMEKKVISEEQYEELRESILSDIKQF